MKEWKLYQEMYRRLVTDHEDASHKQPMVHTQDKVASALDYITRRDEVAHYPGKSYMVAIIYAHLLQREYDEDFYQVLNDPELLMGEDPYFVPYSQDPATYDAILQHLRGTPDWLKGGWAPKTVQYFYLECTKRGIESVLEQQRGS